MNTRTCFAVDLCLIFFFFLFSFYSIHCWIIDSCSDLSLDCFLVCWPPHAERESFITSTCSCSEAIKAKLCCPKASGHCFQCGSAHLLKFSLARKKLKLLIHLCACFSNTYYHSAFNFENVITFRSSEKVLFLWLYLCEVWLECRW